jgi:type II secretory pathway pseudopilin PulG
MTQLIIVMAIVGLLAAIIGALIASKLQSNYLTRTQAQFEAWERAQESHHLKWEIQQENLIAALRKELKEQVGMVENDWEKWKSKDISRIEQLKTQFAETEAQMHLKREIARLPHVEDVPLVLDVHHRYRPLYPNWQPPMLQGSNLTERDLSHRYLGQADLRNAQLLRTNFYMSDLSDACLMGANLFGADLTGANLTGADLRAANLNGANLMVADLHKAILVGANLLGAHNLTQQQLDSAIYDETTLFNIRKERTTSQLNNTQQDERIHSSPLPSSDSLTDPEAAELLGNIPENKHTEEIASTTSSPEYNAPAQAKAN